MPDELSKEAVASQMGPTLKAEANCLYRSVTNQLTEWRNDHRSSALESLDPNDQSLWKMTRQLMRVLLPHPLPWSHWCLSDSEKAEALADILGAQF
jgi:hypothetical protein